MFMKFSASVRSLLKKSILARCFFWSALASRSSPTCANYWLTKNLARSLVSGYFLSGLSTIEGRMKRGFLRSLCVVSLECSYQPDSRLNSNKRW